VEASYEVLGLTGGSSLREVKQRFLHLAKQTHPDVQRNEQESGDASDLPTFLEVITAFEVLEEHTASASEYPASGTAASAAARGGEGGASARKSRVARTAARARSLGEVLCDRLNDEPELARQVWEEIQSRKLRIEPVTLDRLFEACARAAKQRNNDGGLPVALAIMREASQDGLLSPSLREAALVSVIKWNKRDRSSFEEIYASIDEADKTASTMETISYANFLYSGAWDGYSSGR
jgi:curved DNA-binding protein CbpA